MTAPPGSTEYPMGYEGYRLVRVPHGAALEGQGTEQMATVKLGHDNFEDVISANDIVLVDFWASWCGPCQYFAPVFEKAAEQHPDIVFAKVDTEAEQQLAGEFQISSIPTLMVFRDQVLLYSQPGALSAPALAELIARVKEVDMEDVRRQLADRDAAAGPARR